jgi:hypothetical protein
MNDNFITIRWSVIRNFDGRQVEAGKRVLQMLDSSMSAKDHVRDTTKFLKNQFHEPVFTVHINWVPGKFWAL